MVKVIDSSFQFFPNGKEHLLVGYVKPKPDELFSSWLLRLAYAHHTKVYTFTRLILPGAHCWNRDIDRSVPVEIVDTLAKRSNMRFETLFETTLASYQGELFQKDQVKTASRWILPLGVYHRTWRRNGLLFCPQCLAEETPYFRKKWRLALSVICTRCNIYLADCCPNCLSAVIFFRAELGAREKEPNQPITNCYNCGFNLTKTTRITPSNKSLEMQKNLYCILENGYTLKKTYPFVYFDVLYNIIRLISSHKGTTLKKLICKELLLPAEDYGSGFANRFATLSLFQRESLLLISTWLLEKWPNRFIKLVNESKLLSSELLRDFQEPPFWYYSIVYENFYKSNINRKFNW